MEKDYIEEWKPSSRYPNYHVSSLGNIKNIKSGRILKASLSKGYLRLRLSNKGTADLLTIHRIVAEVFCPNPLNKTQVNHIDGNRLNNSASNLEWVTPLENMEHAVANGLHKTLVQRKFSDEEVIDMLKLAKETSNRNACRKYGAAACFLSRVRKGRVYKHLTDIAKEMYAA